MIELQVKVRFDSLCITSGNTPGSGTPIGSFILSNNEFFIDSNGNFFSEPSATVGDQYRYLIDKDGYKWTYGPDGNSQLKPITSTYVGGLQTFWIMLDVDSIVLIIGADTNGGFTTYYLE